MLQYQNILTSHWHQWTWEVDIIINHQPHHSASVIPSLRYVSHSTRRNPGSWGLQKVTGMKDPDYILSWWKTCFPVLLHNCLCVLHCCSFTQVLGLWESIHSLVETGIWLLPLFYSWIPFLFFILVELVLLLGHCNFA